MAHGRPIAPWAAVMSALCAALVLTSSLIFFAKPAQASTSAPGPARTGRTASPKAPHQATIETEGVADAAPASRTGETATAPGDITEPRSPASDPTAEATSDPAEPT